MPRLSDIVGQDAAVDVLRRAAAGGRLAQAYLFGGPAGVGKATTAGVLAAALNCRDAPGEGCDRCPSCDKFDKGLHPDLIRLEPDGRMIKIDQVRALEESLSFTPHEGAVRVILIDGADKLNDNAANALLKSVEEPRPGNLFALVSSSPHGVAPTLVSRCQRIRFGPLSDDDLRRVVSAQGEFGAEELEGAVAVSQGSARRALDLLSGDKIAELQRLADTLWKAANSRSRSAVFDAAATCGKERDRLEEALDLLRLRLRDELLGAEGIGPGGAVDPAAFPPARVSLRRLRALDEAQAALRGYVNVPLLLENLVIGMQIG